MQAEKTGARVGMLYVSNIFNFLRGKKDWSGRLLDRETPATTIARQNLKKLMTDQNPVILHNRRDPALTWPSV